jgi:hypothetical protein
VSGSCIKVATLGCWLPSFKALEMKNLSIAAILGSLFVAGYLFCAICHAQESTPCPTPTEDPGVRGAANLLMGQLKTNDAVERERAATALQAMGKNAAQALADCVKRRGDIASATKAITILAKIGNDLADDCNVREALLSAARLPGTDWPVLQLRLAAIDALGEINKYRGVQFTGDENDPLAKCDPQQILAASTTLADIADGLFKELLVLGKRYDDIETAAAAAAPTVIVCGSTPNPTPTPKPTPTPTPTPPIPTPRDTEFYKDISILQGAQTKLLELADQAAVAASSPKESAAEPAFTKLADAKSLAASLKKIEVAYLDATKTVFAKKATDQADDKSHWQLKTEAAYDLLTESTQLRDELDALTDFTDSRPEVTRLLSSLATIGANNPELRPAVASAINATFSKPPGKKPAAEEAKKDTGKKDADKKDGAATKDADKEKSKSQ